VVSFAIPMPIVVGIGRGPGLVVGHAVLSHGLAVLGQLIGDKVLAGLADTVCEVADGLCSASGSTEANVKRPTVPYSDAHVRVVVIAIEGSIDGDVAQGGRDSVAFGSGLEVIG